PVHPGDARCPGRARGRDRLVVAARPARGPVGRRADARPALLPAVPRLLRARAARFGEGPLEDARPPRFANLVGAVFLTSATVAYAAGFATLGAVLGGTVAALALLAAATGFCTGCEAYKLGSFLVGKPFGPWPLPPRA